MIEGSQKLHAIALGALLVATFGSVPRIARAVERRFAFTYETPVLLPSDAEIEPWSTLRWGRDGFFARADERLEFEFGLTNRLQTSLYFNFGAANEDVVDPVTGTRSRASSFAWEGLSWELKYKLLDRNVRPIGLALYGEARVSPIEIELEGKLIVDRKFGNVLLAFNLVGDQEWSFEGVDTVAQNGLELDLGAAYVFNEGIALGVEVRSDTIFAPAAPIRSALFAGPVVSWNHEHKWWAAVSVTPQIAGVAGAGGSGLDLADHERLLVRVLFGMFVSGSSIF